MRGCLTVGIDVGGTKTAAVLLADAGQVVARITEPTDRSGSPQEIAEFTEGLVDHLLREASCSRDLLKAVGIGLPGLITPGRIFRDSIILPAWRNVDFHSLLQPRLGVPLVVDNDTTMAALGHMATIPEHQRPSCLVCLTLGTGVGGAILLDGIPLRGIDGTAGQVGHTVVDPAGRRCDCGSLGCLNAYASGTAITERFLELQAEDPVPVSTTLVAERVGLPQAISQGDPLARRALDEAVNALIVALSGIVNVLNPEIVVLGGGVASIGKEFIQSIQSRISERSFPAPARRVRVHQAAHGPMTGAIGAGVTATELVLRADSDTL
ncbi:ROK family protein [Streptomyces sp. NPDC102409]|uniref:ROK family protein n=1 Tax=Streptomyces sp. NPDC102409 TaxID=3366172 RepID=UPI0038119E7D